MKYCTIEFCAGAVGLPEGYQGLVQFFDSSGDGIATFMVPDGKVNFGDLIDTLVEQAKEEGHSLNLRQAINEVYEWLNPQA
jgi:hypothetical protein